MQSEGSSSEVFIEFNDSRINSEIIIIHYFRLRFNFELFQIALDHEQKAVRCPLESPAASHLQASLLIRSQMESWPSRTLARTNTYSSQGRPRQHRTRGKLAQQ